MLTETRRERAVAVRDFPGPRLEAVLGLLVFPVGFLVGVLSALLRLLRRPRPLPAEPRFAIVEGGEPLRDVAAFARDVEDADFSPRWGFGSLDFQLAYAPDLVPSLLDLSPRFANRFFRNPPPFRRVTIESLDGTPIAAEVAVRDDRERPGLVIAHGTFGSTGQEIYSRPAVRAFADWGFNVASVDLRGWGRSMTLSRAPISGGWRESEDVLAAARWLMENSRTSGVGAIGYSLGGAAVLLAAAHDLAPACLPLGVFSESGFADARKIMRIADENPGLLAREFVTYLIFHYGLATKLRWSGEGGGVALSQYLERVAAPYYGVTPEELFDRATVLGRVADIRVPAFHLHAADDWVVPVEHAFALRDEAERVGNRLVGVCVEPRGGHCAFARVAEKWRDRVARELFAGTAGVRLVDREV